MRLIFRNKEITSILSVLPSKEVNFEDEMENYNFSESQSLKLKKVMGYNKKRVADEGVTSTDLCVFGLNYLIKNNVVKRRN